MMSYVQRREAELKAEMNYLGFIALWNHIADAMNLQREADYWTEEFAKLRAKYVRRGRKAGTKIVKKPEGQILAALKAKGVE